MARPDKLRRWFNSVGLEGGPDADVTRRGPARTWELERGEFLLHWAELAGVPQRRLVFVAAELMLRAADARYVDWRDALDPRVPAQLFGVAAGDPWLPDAAADRERGQGFDALYHAVAAATVSVARPSTVRRSNAPGIVASDLFDELRRAQAEIEGVSLWDPPGAAITAAARQQVGDAVRALLPWSGPRTPARDALVALDWLFERGGDVRGLEGVLDPARRDDPERGTVAIVFADHALLPTEVATLLERGGFMRCTPGWAFVPPVGEIVKRAAGFAR